MNLTALWFVINLFFVASFIITLFMHRAVTMASQHADDTRRSNKLRSIRNGLVATTIVLFIAMSAAFISNMYMNG
ncbi:hypothetical protein ACFP56_07195 [Paenibacillus septentrionalis]|uniref:DUF2909 domain-containing protein n=1 Tax=Paenibacillus septentrionalis TaxID=429342 RepID=A0ABW1V0Z3_9BACL